MPLPVAHSAAQPANGFGGWLAGLSPRDRLIYLLMISLLGLIMLVYIAAGLQSLSGMPQIGGAPTALTAAPTQPGTTPTASASGAAQTATAAANAAPTEVRASPTALPTSTPSPQPTAEPTQAPVYFPPTATVATSSPVPPSSTVASTTTAAATPVSPSATTSAGTPVPPSATAAAGTPALPSSTVAPSASPAANTPTVQAPSATRQPTVQPTAPLEPSPQPTARPTARPTVRPTAQPQPTTPPQPTAQPQPTAAPAPEISNQFVWLYFGDASGTLYVPVQRRVTVENRQVARAAVLGLLEGPRTGLTALVARDARLLDLRIEDGTAVVNFDRDPSGGDGRGHDALVLTLTHFNSIARVQIQAGGRNIGGPRTRPVVNPINPLGLPADPRQTEFLPLYFVSNDGYHHIRVIRMVPKTRQTAEGTMRALLEGPGGYGYALQRVIPEGTDLRGISLSDGVVTVDLTQPFADTGDRASAVRTVTESLTTLPGVRGVRFLIEGAPAADWWGPEYGKVFERPLINGE